MRRVSPTVQFNLQQLALVRQVQGRSEGLVARRFSIPALPSSLYPYEVATLADLDEHERAAGALAHLVVYQRQRASEVEHHYRVCLQDDIILRRLERWRGASLEDVLTYVLTHELIHVVRFQRDEQSYLASEASRQEEEELVHAATLELLRQAGLRGAEALEDPLPAESVSIKVVS